jgi:hypothetical protein
MVLATCNNTQQADRYHVADRATVHRVSLRGLPSTRKETLLTDTLKIDTNCGKA